MWKDFLYFSKSQRIGIISLLILILLVGLAIYFISVYTVNEPTPNSAFLAKARDFDRGLVLQDSLKRAQWSNKYTNSTFENKTNTENSYTLFNFDPNTLDSVGFTKLGLKNYVAGNILKFRSKGGRFKNSDAFSKVYGLSYEKFKELDPYIHIADIKAAVKDSTKLKQVQKPENYTAELNTADTTELMKVRGVGRFYAKAIVRFRQLTGGFVNIEQLKEIYGMNETNFNKISPFCTVNPLLIKKIAINSASVEKLNAHIYLDFYESKAIYEMRRKKGKLKSINELKSISELKPETIEKITPYLSFE